MFIEKIKSILGSPLTVKILNSVLIIGILWVLVLIIRRIITRNVREVKSQYTWNKIIGYISALLGIFLVGRIWLQGVQSIATFLGLLSAGIAIALKDLLANLAGWLFIVSRRSFEVGDRIQLGSNAGDVIDIGLFQFSILEIGNWVHADQSTGRIIHIPNGKIFNNELANYDKGFKYIWNEIEVILTFESNWEKAKQILQNIIDNQEESITSTMERQIKKAARKFMIYYRNLTPIVYTDVVDNGVKLTIRYLCETRKRRGSSQSIWESILREFVNHDDIDFAYPTTRFYNNLTEGKNPQK
ncbi:MAG: mechanosensitive ion channel family protein [Candidatus Cloacimonetes bacterium]|nr:mechanosensitive ion channel family protein [Candidatus Cloacimonadota bacterium]